MITNKSIEEWLTTVKGRDAARLYEVIKAGQETRHSYDALLLLERLDAFAAEREERG